jgi:hypothetical protein
MSPGVGIVTFDGIEPLVGIVIFGDKNPWWASLLMGDVTSGGHRNCWRIQPVVGIVTFEE